MRKYISYNSPYTSNCAHGAQLNSLRAIYIFLYSVLESYPSRGFTRLPQSQCTAYSIECTVYSRSSMCSAGLANKT